MREMFDEDHGRLQLLQPGRIEDFLARMGIGHEQRVVCAMALRADHHLHDTHAT